MRTCDEAEFTEFVAATTGRLCRMAYLMCGDWHRAEDAVQDAMVKVYRRWRHLHRGDRLSGYANRVVVTTVLDQRRRSWRREVLTADGAVRSDDSSPDAARCIDDRLQVVQALAALPPGQRACVVLRHYADLSVEETAEILGVGAGGVKSQTARGLDRLRELMVIAERSPV